MGSTDGTWDGTNKGETDFAAVKLDSDGVEDWRYHVSGAERCLLFVHVFGKRQSAAFTYFEER